MLTALLRTNTNELHVWLKAGDELVLYDLSIVPARIKTDAFADDNSWFRERCQSYFPIACTIRVNIPRKTN
jgi:hypothetical protein